MNRYLLKSSLLHPKGYWWLIISDTVKYGDIITLENRYGGRHNTAYRNERIIEATSWDNLDWSTVLLDKDSIFGYIAPNGKWYGCSGCDFEDVAKLILHIDCPEENGYVKIYSKGDRIDYYKNGRLTNKQLCTLIDRKIKIHDNDLED